MSTRHPPSLTTVPEIVLPSSWCLDTAVAHRHAVGPEASSCNNSVCPRCLWNRHPAKLFPWGGDDSSVRLHPITRQEEKDCIRCQILHLAADAAGVELGLEDEVWVDEDGCTIDLSVNGDVLSLDIFADSDKASAPKWIPQGVKSPPDDTSSTGSLDWAKNEIELCRQSHTHCSSASNAFTPTRLIDVRPQNADGDVVLRDASTVPHGSQYCALSYCWGKLKPACLTTKATLPQRQAGIPWSTLPLTFQDAVKFSRSIGIDYLWIDSVCIIQGDEADWSRESSRMFQVYGNAYVTLVAATGADSGAGLFSVRHNRPPATHVANLRDEASDKTWPLYVRKAHDNFYNWDNEELQGMLPLLQRAWCYQERLISPRTLLFMPGEMAFQCFGRVSCECGRDDASREDGTSNTKHKHTVPRLTGGSDDVSLNSSQIWWLVVGSYASLDITVPGDRLPAVAGVAEYVHRFRPEEQYLAGLWSGTLITDLLWAVDHPPEGTRTKTAAVTRTAPGWSWASGQQARTVQGFARNLEALAKVQEARCEYTSESPYGIPTSSRLVLKGRLWTFFGGLERRGGSVWLASSRLVFRLKNPGTKKNMFAIDDGKPKHEWLCLSRFYLLEMRRRATRKNADMRYYLILKSISKSTSTYVRIGYFYTTEKSLSGIDQKKWDSLGVDSLCTIE